MSSRIGPKDTTADLGLWVEADSLPELFESAATTLGEIMVLGPRDGEIAWHPLDISGPDYVDLLVRLLSEVVYLLDAHQLVTVACHISELQPARLSARLGTIPYDPSTHQPGEDVKAVTYHEASVAPSGPRWRAEVVFDV
ncbi:MAG: archease [Deltaproteobacteria bacterium]|nr:archease [Deltaproteobacteria bacterium]